MPGHRKGQQTVAENSQHSTMESQLANALVNIQFVVLFGGASGSGKTTIAQQIVDGTSQSSFISGTDISISRTDSKSLYRKSFPAGGLIVEIATDRLISEKGKAQCRTFLEALQRHTQIRGAHNIEIDAHTVFWRYLLRMRGMQFLHLGKLKKLLFSLLKIHVESGMANWKSILDEFDIPYRAWPSSDTD